MTSFQDLLLKPVPGSMPGEKQLEASRQLPTVVQNSQFKWWDQASQLPTVGGFLLLIVAPYSHYDLALLDLLNEQIGRRSILLGSQSVPVYVANLLTYPSAESLLQEFPIVKNPPLQTPLTLMGQNGAWVQSAEGKWGRDLAATALGIVADTLNQQVIARVPRPVLG